MKTNKVLEFIESKGYTLCELRGTPVPVFKLDGPDSALQFAIINPNQYYPSRQPTELEQEMMNSILQELQANEFKFISYDFSLDNSQ